MVARCKVTLEKQIRCIGNAEEWETGGGRTGESRRQWEEERGGSRAAERCGGHWQSYWCDYQLLQFASHATDLHEQSIAMGLIEVNARLELEEQVQSRTKILGKYQLEWPETWRPSTRSPTERWMRSSPIGSTVIMDTSCRSTKAGGWWRRRQWQQWWCCYGNQHTWKFFLHRTVC